MKNFNKIFLLGIVIMFSLTSCDKYFGDTNVNPNSTSNVPPKLLLPTIQLTINYGIAGDGARFGGIYSQQLDGVSRQFVAYQNYTIRGGDFDPLWQQNLYGALKTLKELKRIASEKNYDLYNGIAKTMEAYTLLFLTDFFGDIPYSEALEGFFVKPTPKFDTQAEIFTKIFALLGEARTHLSNSADDPIKPGADDLIYGGNAKSWTDFTYAIEARGRLHLSKKDASQYALALTAAQKFTVAAPAIKYSTDPSGNAPFYQYNEQRGDIAIGDSYVALMESLNDPRAEIYGAPLDTDHPILTLDQAVPLMYGSEIEFIKAECMFNTGNATGAKDAYISAIKKSFAEAKASGVDAYLAQTTIVPTGAITLSHIITQKYIALFADPEVSCDWRRTGLPSLAPNSGNSVPRRFAYPQTEINYNPNTPTYDKVNIFTPVAWDK